MQSSTGQVFVRLDTGQKTSLHIAGLMGGGTDHPEPGELVKLSFKDGRAVSGRRITWPRVGRGSLRRFCHDLQACIQLSPVRACKWLREMEEKHWQTVDEQIFALLLQSDHTPLRDLALRNSHRVQKETARDSPGEPPQR